MADLRDIVAINFRRLPREGRHRRKENLRSPNLSFASSTAEATGAACGRRTWMSAGGGRTAQAKGNLCWGVVYTVWALAEAEGLRHHLRQRV